MFFTRLFKHEFFEVSTKSDIWEPRLSPPTPFSKITSSEPFFRVAPPTRSVSCSFPYSWPLRLVASLVRFLTRDFRILLAPTLTPKTGSHSANANMTYAGPKSPFFFVNSVRNSDRVYS